MQRRKRRELRLLYQRKAFGCHWQNDTIIRLGVLYPSTFESGLLVLEAINESQLVL